LLICRYNNPLKEVLIEASIISENEDTEDEKLRQKIEEFEDEEGGEDGDEDENEE
jgi:hypothetical protein